MSHLFWTICHFTITVESVNFILMAETTIAIGWIVVSDRGTATGLFSQYFLQLFGYLVLFIPTTNRLKEISRRFTLISGKFNTIL